MPFREKSILLLEEVDLGDKFAIIIDFEGTRRKSDTAGSDHRKSSVNEDFATNIDDIYDCTPSSSPLSSRNPSISSRSALHIPPDPTQFHSLDLPDPVSEAPRPSTPIKAIEAVIRTPPNGRHIRREPSPVSEPTSSLRA